eukprot:g6242.t1
MSNSNDNKYIVDSGVKSPSEGGMNVKRRKSISIEHTPLDHEKKRPSIVTTVALDGTKKRKLKRTQSNSIFKQVSDRKVVTLGGVFNKKKMVHLPVIKTPKPVKYVAFATFQQFVEHEMCAMASDGGKTITVYDHLTAQQLFQVTTSNGIKGVAFGEIEKNDVNLAFVEQCPASHNLSHYQHLPHVIIGICNSFYEKINADTAILFLLSTMPIMVFYGSKKLGFNSAAAVFITMLYPIINDCPPPQNRQQGVQYSYGIGINSQIHNGHGLFSQLLAIYLFFPALGISFNAMVKLHQNRNETWKNIILASMLISSVLLSNVFYGYMVLGSLCILEVLLLTIYLHSRITTDGIQFIFYQFKQTNILKSIFRFLLILVLVGSMISYFVIPFLKNRYVVNEIEHRKWKFDSVGWTWFYIKFMDGDLLDFGFTSKIITNTTFNRKKFMLETDEEDEPITRRKSARVITFALCLVIIFALLYPSLFERDKMQHSFNIATLDKQKKRWEQLSKQEYNSILTILNREKEKNDGYLKGRIFTGMPGYTQWPIYTLFPKLLEDDWPMIGVSI